MKKAENPHANWKVMFCLLAAVCIAFFAGAACSEDDDDDSTPTATGTGITLPDELSVMFTLTGLSGRVTDIWTDNSYAYVVGPDMGLVILNVIDKLNASQVGSLALDEARGITVVGSTAYVANGMSGLAIVNVVSKSSPVVLGNCVLGGNANDVAVSGDYAFVANGTAGLCAVDISNSSNPSYVSAYTRTSDYLSVAVDGDMVYAALKTHGLYAVDFSTITAPVMVNTSYSYGYYVYTEIEDGYVYVCSHAMYGVGIFDVTDPAARFEAESRCILYCPIKVDVQENQAFILDNNSGLFILDVSDKTLPEYEWTYTGMKELSALFVCGDHVYIGNNTGSLAILAGFRQSVVSED